MRRFLGAALTHCKMYPNDMALVLHCLGSPESAGLQRLAEICQFPRTVSVSGEANFNACCIMAKLAFQVMPNVTCRQAFPERYVHSKESRARCCTSSLCLS